MPWKYTPEQRLTTFWAKVDRNGPIPAHCPELGPCWIWTGSRHPDGRGQVHFRRRTYIAATVAYILTYGDPPPEKPWVLHACDGGHIACVRPDHLFIGTLADNNADMAIKERTGTAKLSRAFVRQARARHAAGGITYQSLAREAGVSLQAMRNAVLGKTWRHVI